LVKGVVATDEQKTPLFSILLPTHNRADVLPFAIRSVLWQTVQNFEVSIVGDGCTDATADVIGAFHDDRFRWFDLPKGPRFGYGNRNVALREAKGTYVAFMAHDDLWLPDHLQLLADCLRDDRIEIAYSRPLWVAPNGTITPSTYNLNHPATLEAFLARRPHSIPAGCVVHRRSCFAKYGYWDESLPFAGDQDLWARIIDGGGRKNFVYLPEPTCLHFKAIWKTERNVGPAEINGRCSIGSKTSRRRR
jgi:glycosyltransferase involved in cell wall biosynthesis